MWLAMSVPTYAGQSELLEGIRSVHGLAAERLERVAIRLLDGFFAGGSEVVSRRNAIIDVCQQMGVGGPDRRVAARLLAEAWQVLELNGLICRDPDQTPGEWWFLTRGGRDFMKRRDREAGLALPWIRPEDRPDPT